MNIQARPYRDATDLARMRHLLMASGQLDALPAWRGELAAQRRIGGDHRLRILNQGRSDCRAPGRLPFRE